MIKSEVTTKMAQTSSDFEKELDLAQLFTTEEIRKGIYIKVLKKVRPFLCKKCQDIINEEIVETILKET